MARKLLINDKNIDFNVKNSDNSDIIISTSKHIIPKFPDIEGLDEEKAIIGTGIVDLNRALYEQVSYESKRLPRIRKILSNIEDSLLDEDSIENMSPDLKLRLFETLRKDSETLVNFLERMQRNSLQVTVMFDIYKRLMEAIDNKEDSYNKGVSNEVDKDKLMGVKNKLLKLMEPK